MIQDTGCGIGGPARHISTFTGVKITGITINEYQVNRATLITRQAKLSHMVIFEKVRGW